MKIKSILWTFCFLIGLTGLSARAQNYLADDLAAFFPFNGNAIDQKRNYNGAVGRAFLISDRHGKRESAYGFGGNAWINLPNTLLDGKNNAGTISLWFKTDSPNPPQLENLFAAHGHGNGQPNRIYLTIDKGRVIATIGNPSQDLVTAPIVAQKWYHVCLVWSNRGNSAALFLNGAKVGDANGISLKPSIEAINLGAWKQEGGFLHGAIDDVRIYNRALSPIEVKSLFTFESQSQPTANGLAQINDNAEVLTEKTLPDVPQAVLDAAAKALQPTNNFTEISEAKGEVIVLDSKGLVLKGTNGYLPRIPIAELSEKDFRALLETKKSYDALVSFRNGKTRTAKSEIFESRLNDIWRQEKSLNKKVQTRLEILDEMRGYNLALSSLRSLLGLASNAGAKVDKANSTIAVKETIASATSKDIDKARELRSYGIEGSRRAEYEARKDLKKTEAEIDNALNVANSAANNLRATEQQADAYLSKCQSHAFRLANYGINVSTAPPFETIPTLSIRLEVDVERVR